MEYATAKLLEIEGLRILVQQRKKRESFFLVGSIHPYDLGTILDKLGIA